MHLSSRSKVGLFISLVTVFSIAGAFLLNVTFQPHTSHAANANVQQVIKFPLVPSSAGITTCLPHASGEAEITRTKLNDVMTVEVKGMPANTGFDLFVIEIPKAPFGISWYQSDLETSANGIGSATVRGIFNVETFSVAPIGGPTVSFSPTHQYHLGLWFNDPQVPFNLGCEGTATSPIVTPFNGAQNAGIQVLNTSNFPDNAGPLSTVAP
jgi:hypothetical protein